MQPALAGRYRVPGTSKGLCRPCRTPGGSDAASGVRARRSCRCPALLPRPRRGGAVAAPPSPTSIASFKPHTAARWERARTARRSQRIPGDSGFDLFGLRKRDRRAFTRLREVEIIHARWAMLGVLSLLIGDAASNMGGVGGDSGGFPAAAVAAAPWAAGLLLVLALVETYRMAALWGEEDLERRAYPGDRFDPLGLARPRAPGPPPAAGVWSSWLGGAPGWLAGGWWWGRREPTAQQVEAMKARELRNGRLAMVSFAGVCAAAIATGAGPVTLLLRHLADPAHNTVLQTLGVT